MPPGTQRPVIAAILLAAVQGLADKPLELTSPHYKIWSSAPEPRAKKALDAGELLHANWVRWTGDSVCRTTVPHRLRLFRSRREMRTNLPNLGWAEAIYHDRTCDQYDDPSADKPLQWLIHEATHQLVAEDAGIELPRWANEGLACLFSVSRIHGKRIDIGSVEPETYPTWWLRRTPPSGYLARDLREELLIPPSRFLSESDLRSIAESVNAHYLSWWALVHYFNAENPKAWRDWVLHDRTTGGLEKRFGPLSTLDDRWYVHVLALRDSARRI